MLRWLSLTIFLLLSPVLFADNPLPFSTVFKGEARFHQLVKRAKTENWKSLPIGERTAAVGYALTGTPYKGYTLEIDDRIEAPSVNLYGLDCWTFFEISLAFARMLDEPEQNYTPQTLLKYIEQDRYRHGKCTGEYLSRLHYLEDWADDNDKRGLVKDLSKELGGVQIKNVACEMSNGWKHYRYLRSNPSLLPAMRAHEDRVTHMTVYHIPKYHVASVESQLRNGDIIGITTKYKGAYCSHVGLAWRDKNGVLRFMHASSPKNHGKVLVDKRLSAYLQEFSAHAGIIVARPLK